MFVKPPITILAVLVFRHVKHDILPIFEMHTLDCNTKQFGSEDSASILMAEEGNNISNSRHRDTGPIKHRQQVES